jgi:hypothetical protein
MQPGARRAKVVKGRPGLPFAGSGVALQTARRGRAACMQVRPGGLALCMRCTSARADTPFCVVDRRKLQTEMLLMTARHCLGA